MINLNAEGDIEDFSMNDKYAAGTGRFLEMLVNKLDLGYEKFVAAALKSETRIHMNPTCAVFAESEVVSLLAKGVSKVDIAGAAHNAIAGRISFMLRRLGGAEHKEIYFAGGGRVTCHWSGQWKTRWVKRSSFWKTLRQLWHWVLLWKHKNGLSRG